MCQKNLYMLHTFYRTLRIFGQHWQSVIGLSICCVFIFSTYGQTYSFYIDAIEGTTFHESSSQPTSLLEQVSTDTLLIGMSPELTSQAAERLLHRYGPKDVIVEKFWPEFNIALIRIPKLSDSSVMASSANAMQQLEEYRTEFTQIPSVRYADYNGLISIPLTYSPLSEDDSDESYRMVTQQGAINSQAINDQEIVVAILGSGYDTTDKDPNTYSLWENQAEIDGVAGVDDDNNGFIDDIHGWNWGDDNNVIDGPTDYGTEVIDTLLNAVTDLDGDRLSVKIQLLRLLGEDGSGDIAGVVDALAYALRTGTPIVNFSIAIYYNSSALEDAIKIAYSKDLLMFSSIGNLSNFPYYPSLYPETIAVVWAMDAYGIIGADIAISNDTESLLPDLAPAHAIAVTTQMLLQRPDWSHSMVKSILLSTADYISDDGPQNAFLRTNYGILNVEAALNPGLIFDPPVLDFGSIITGTQKTVVLQVTNVATQTETYQLDTYLPAKSCLSPKSIGMLDFDKQSFTLDPNMSTTIEVAFDSNSQDLGHHINLISMVSQHHNLDLPAWGQLSVDNTPLSYYRFDMVADVQIESNLSTALIDDTIIYTILIVNQDTNSLQNVIVEGNISDQVIFVPEQSSPAWEEENGSLKLVLDNIPLDGLIQLNVAVQVDQDMLDLSDAGDRITYISLPRFTIQSSDCILSPTRRGDGTIIIRDLSVSDEPTDGPLEGLGTQPHHIIYLPIMAR